MLATDRLSMHCSSVARVIMEPLYFLFFVFLIGEYQNCTLFYVRVLRDQLEFLDSLVTKQRRPNDPDRLEPIDHFPPVDLGPDPSDLLITENELLSENAMELNKLRAIVSRTKAELAANKAELERRKKQTDKTL